MSRRARRASPHPFAGGLRDHGAGAGVVGQRHDRCVVEPEAHHRVEDLLLGGFVVQVRARGAARRDRAAHPLPRVVLRVGVADAAQQLGVCGHHVEGLHEGFLRDLPVAGQHLLHVRLGVAAREVPVVEFGELAEVLAQRDLVGVEADEDEAAPGVHAHLRQREGLVLHLREVPTRRHSLQFPVEVPAEAVELALQLARPAAAGIAQPTAAVQAGVVEPADHLVRAADQQDRDVRDLVDLEVAGFAQPFLAARELPGVPPDRLLLQRKHVAVEVEVGRNVRGPEVAAPGASQELGHLVRVGVEQVLVARARGARGLRFDRRHCPPPCSVNPAR